MKPLKVALSNSYFEKLRKFYKKTPAIELETCDRTLPNNCDGAFCENFHSLSKDTYLTLCFKTSLVYPIKNIFLQLP